MPLLRSWVDTANDPEGDFPLNNLPFGVFSDGDPEDARCCVAIGDQVLDLAKVEESGLLELDVEHPVFDLPFLNEFMELGPDAWDAVRARLLQLLAEGATAGLQELNALIPMSRVEMHLPFIVNEYTDFYAGKHHAMNIGTMLRGAENALPPNWLHIPIGYNGRASTVVVSGTDVRRPLGQTKAKDAAVPSFGPCKRLDIELELGAVVGIGNEMGKPISVAEADRMIFGYVLLNDWSARDIQGWEYQPLGPFQAKAFATSISPWVITRAALEPFRCATPAREVPLLPYLEEPGPMLYDIPLTVLYKTHGSDEEVEIARTNYREMYYSSAQQLTHHAIGGCAMNCGDLLGSGTISGAEETARGSLMELTWNGQNPLNLPGGARTFLEDGDTVVLTGGCAGDGYRIGFGRCEGTILPSPKLKEGA